MKDIITLRTLSKEDILKIVDRAKELEENPNLDLLNGKILSTVFFEPSTRTKLSFISAMYKLGGKVIELDGGGNNSLKKGESISDTLRMMGLYTDIMAVRAPYEGTAKRASEILNIPVINAGDGANQHPTQTLLDLYTIKKEKGTLEGLKVAFVGDLKYGRTVHSLAKALNKFNCELYFIAPDEMQIPDYVTDELTVKYTKLKDYKEVIGELDIFYMTRIQRERFENPLDYDKCKGFYQIDKTILDVCKKNMKILHPLPRVDEISTDLDDTPNAVYFEQAENGVYARQAILDYLMSEGEKENSYDEVGEECKNPKCISFVERLEGKWIVEESGKRCFYCEKLAK